MALMMRKFSPCRNPDWSSDPKRILPKPAQKGKGDPQKPALSSRWISRHQSKLAHSEKRFSIREVIFRLRVINNHGLLQYKKIKDSRYQSRTIWDCQANVCLESLHKSCSTIASHLKNPGRLSASQHFVFHLAESELSPQFFLIKCPH